MPLALECEWGNDEAVLDDFQKLLVSRADLRVMVFGEGNESTKGTIERLREQIKSYRRREARDRFLLVGYDGGNPTCEYLDGTGTTLWSERGDKT